MNQITTLRGLARALVRRKDYVDRDAVAAIRIALQEAALIMSVDADEHVNIDNALFRRDADLFGELANELEEISGDWPEC